MTRRLQIRIMAGFVLVLLFIGGVFGYVKWSTSANVSPSSNKTVKDVTYAASDKLAIFQIRWKKEVKPNSAKNKDNYYVEHVFPRYGKWLTAVDGKKCNISFIQHVIDKSDPTKNSRITQLSVQISPKQETNDFYRVRARNLEYKEGGKMDNVEYGVIKVSNFANFTKK